MFSDLMPATIALCYISRTHEDRSLLESYPKLWPWTIPIHLAKREPLQLPQTWISKQTFHRRLSQM